MCTDHQWIDCSESNWTFIVYTGLVQFTYVSLWSHFTKSWTLRTLSPELCTASSIKWMHSYWSKVDVSYLITDGFSLIVMVFAIMLMAMATLDHYGLVIKGHKLHYLALLSIDISKIFHRILVHCFLSGGSWLAGSFFFWMLAGGDFFSGIIGMNLWIFNIFESELY